jgi:antitoxin VapB
MHLNIKNDRAHELATELARLTGENLTTAVTRALEERLDRERNGRSVEERVKEIMEIVRAAGPSYGATSDHDDLYDERGLPRE